MGVDRIGVVLSPEQLTESGKLILAALNTMQLEHGLDVDQAIACAMWTMGYAIAHRGAILYLDEPLRDAMPGFVASYQRYRAQTGN